MTKKQIDNYSIMITSKYFESIDDFINLEFAVKRFEGNMERFHFNPIRLDYYSRKFFTNLETLHLYDEDDVLFNDGMIFKHCIWYKLDYKTYLKQHEKGNDCKLISYTANDRNIYGLKIPINVKILHDYCFSNCRTLKPIEIPSSVVKLGNFCFFNCTSLTSITIPKTITYMGESCFRYCHLRAIEIPNGIKELDSCFLMGCGFLKTITIPSSVTKLGDYCFRNCIALESIKILSSHIEVGFECFGKCSSLTQIDGLPSLKKIGKRCFIGCSNLAIAEESQLSFQVDNIKN